MVSVLNTKACRTILDFDKPEVINGFDVGVFFKLLIISSTNASVLDAYLMLPDDCLTFDLM